METVTIILTAIETLMKVMPTIIQTEQDLKPYAMALFNQIEGRAPTADEQIALEAGIDNLFARSQEPLPPAQPGDPDYKA